MPESNRKFSGKMQKKLAVLFGTVVLVFIVLAGRITQINAMSGAKYERRVLEQQNYSSRIIPFRRGDIMDRNGTVLATSEKVYHVILDCQVLQAKEERKPGTEEATLTALETVFGISKDESRAKLEEAPQSRYVILKKGVPYEKAREWDALLEEADNIYGVWLEEDYHRFYPYGSLASDLLGFTADGNVGNWGVEQSANDILNGENGREYGYLNSDYGFERTVRQAVNGQNVMLTIDANLQSIVEKHILSFNEDHRNQARQGLGSENTGVIIMDPDSGEILAMASYPSFDLNNPRDLTPYYTDEEIADMSDEDKIDALQNIWRNYCISDTYEPGSTAKPFTMAAGFESGAILGNETYYCGGYSHVGDWDIACHLTSGHGMVDLKDAIAQSCNVALMEIADAIGKENFIRYQADFGFGQFTGIDVPGEADTYPLIYHDETMRDTDLATNSFGQNFNVTMIQMASAYCSLINGGSYYRPHVIREIRDENGGIIETKKPELLKETVTDETSEILREYMRAVVEEGTGTLAAVGGFDVAGKTGTAERLPRGNEEYVISFAGFAPADDPEVLIYVVIDRPNAYSQEDTSMVTQLTSDILREVLPYLHVRPIPGYDFSQEEDVEESYLDEYQEEYPEDYDDEYYYDDNSSYNEDYYDEDWYEEDYYEEDYSDESYYDEDYGDDSEENW